MSDTQKETVPLEKNIEPNKKKKTPQGKEKKKRKKEVKVSPGVDVLPSTDDGTIGINSNRGKAVINLDHIDTILHRSGGSIVSGQKDSFVKLGYVLAVGGNVPSGSGPVKDTRPVSIGAKGHKIKFTNISKQAIWLSVMRPLAAEHDPAALGFLQEKAQEYVLEPEKSFTVNMKKDFDSPLESYVADEIYVENIAWFQAYRTDQLDATLVNSDGTPNFNADVLEVEIESTYYGEPSSNSEGAFHTFDFAKSFPAVATRDLGVRKARGTRIKLGKHHAWLRNTKSSRMLTLDYDVHMVGTGLGFDFANYDDAQLGWKSMMVLGYCNESVKPWTRVRTDSWKKYILCLPGAGGLAYKQYGELGMNLGGGLAKWSPAHDGFIMWDFARDGPSYIDYGYGSGYEKYRHGVLPAKGQIQVIEQEYTQAKAAFSAAALITGLGLLVDIIKLTITLIENFTQSQNYVASVKRLTAHGADPLKDEETRKKHEASTLHPRPSLPAAEYFIIQDETAWLATEFEKVKPPEKGDGGHPSQD